MKTKNFVKLPKGYLDMGRAELSELDIPVLRVIFQKTREISEYFMGREAAMQSAQSRNPESPVDWILAVRKSVCDCERCRATGTYCWGGTVNGVPVHSAPCARCNGKGKLNFDDMRRSRAYDKFAINRAARAMMGG